MPELPEVETTVKDLNKKVLLRTFIDVWTDFKKMIRLRPPGFGRQVKKPDFEDFKKELIGKTIEKIRRRGKNILFELSEGKTLLIHQKLTGHLLYGIWEREKDKWRAKTPGFLQEKVNTYIHLIFFLDNGEMLALSDLRKFAKVELWKSEELKNSKEFKNLGPEPLNSDFNFEKFKKIFKNKKGKIKQVLMNQEVIAGIGNIYSDEILWHAKIHPLREISSLTEQKLRIIYQNIQKVLKEAIKLRGESISDFRDLEGRKGYFDKARKVYQREGEKCSRCGAKIKRIKLAGRSAHFCPHCQRQT